MRRSELSSSLDKKKKLQDVKCGAKVVLLSPVKPTRALRLLLYGIIVMLKRDAHVERLIHVAATEI